MLRLWLSFDIDDYSIYDDTTTISLSLTERQAAILLSIAVLLRYRDGWQPMNDADWDNLDDYLSEILEVLP